MGKLAVSVVSEDLTQPVDEGIKHFAYSLIGGWSKEGNVRGFSLRTPKSGDHPIITQIMTNRLFLSARLRSEIRRLRPDIICYVPSASATLFSLMRARVLKSYWPAAKVVMVSLQPRQYNRTSRRVLRLIPPDMIFVQNEGAAKGLADFGYNAKFIPSGVDLDKFKPVSAEKKRELRAKYQLEPSAFTVLHVGHATAARNLEFLTRVRSANNAQVVFVGSSLPHGDRQALTSRLREKGVVVLNEYYPNIEEIYQLADCYLFPVFSDQACIGVPLSVLEAMACNLPVVSVRYGTLPAYFEQGEGLVFADSPETLLSGVASAANWNGSCRTRDKVTPYSWQNIAQFIVRTTLNEGSNNAQ